MGKVTFDLAAGQQGILCHYSDYCRFACRFSFRIIYAQVHLKHLQTGVYLASHNKKYNRPIAGQTEVCGKIAGDNWLSADGVYFPPR